MSNAALNADERAGVTGNGKTSLTIDQAAVKLTGGEGGWTQLGTPAVVTYAFRATAPSQMPDETSGFSQFTSAQIAATEKALKLWADVANISFVRVGAGKTGASAYSNNATILFSDYAAGQANVLGFGYFPGSTNPSSLSGDVWISTAYSSNTAVSADGGTGFAALLHEIGHAIGLDHPSDYTLASDQTSVSYARNASYAEDSQEYTVMSYFGLSDSGGRNGFGATTAPRTPLIDDIAAAQLMYGANTATNAGNTVYGYRGSRFLTGGAQLADDHLTYGNAYPNVYGLWGAIWDGGGIDTIDFTASTASVRLDLRGGAFSDIGSDIGMFSIAQGVTIENGIGGTGYDTIIGNDANNILMGGDGGDTLSGGAGDDQIYGGGATDTMTGGAGADMFIGALADFAGDSITDFSAGDRIRITDATFGSLNFTQSGAVVSFGTTLLFVNGPSVGKLVASAAPGGGVDLMIEGSAGGTGTGGYVKALHDFNGDGRSDILWRSDGGAISDWLANARGGFVGNDAAAYAQVSANWHIVGDGDFNGDGRSDILWRSDGGVLSDWLGAATGGFVANDAAAYRQVATNWTIAGTGDFNGDGRSDILWRSDSGATSNWLGIASGGFVANDAAAYTQVATNWTIAGTGDFNGDGRSDILWRNGSGALSDWLGTASGGFTANDGAALTRVSSDWHVAGTGDFNGDGRDDILWRNDSGLLSDWLGTANGGFVANDAAALVSVSTNWHVAGTGDFNGDGRDDILWRSDGGALSDWLGTVTGGFVANDTAAFAQVSVAWHTQIHEDFLI